MKRILIISVSLFFSLTLCSQSVALHRNGETQIFRGTNAFIDANNSAQDGDTLYLSGLNFNGGVIYFDKSLKIYGVGSFDTATAATGKTYVDGNIRLRQGADGFHIEGVNFGHLSVDNNSSVNNLTVKRCYLSGSISFGTAENPSEDFLLTGSVINGSVSLTNTIHPRVTNNIINGRIITTKNVITNNIILGNVNYNTIEGSDNIFLNNYLTRAYGGYTSRITGNNGNEFYYNVFNASSPTLGTNYISENNKFGVSMGDFFVKKEGSTYNIEDDYHLQNPGDYIGEDSTQVGIYGGDYPYKEWAIPVIPHIESVDIPYRLNEDGNLPVNIKVSAQKEQD